MNVSSLEKFHLKMHKANQVENKKGVLLASALSPNNRADAEAVKTTEKNGFGPRITVNIA